jgi:hypothetical protein
MYRIRLTSGEEAVYRSTEELAQAVTSGLVGADSDVFHNAANRWLPIALHPDYRRVVTGKRPAITTAMVETTPPGSAPPAASPPTANANEPELAPATFWTGLSDVEYDPSLDPTPLLSRQRVIGKSKTRTSRAKRLRIMLALAGGLAGVGVVGGGGLATWRYMLPWLEHHHSRPGLWEGLPPAPESSSALKAADTAPMGIPRSDSFQTRHPAPTPPLAPALAPLQRPVPDTVTGTRTARLLATRNRTPGYFEAYADARAEMDEALDYINFQRVFAAARFAAPESVRATRRMVSAAGNILRVYRGHEVMMEQTYRPDDPGGKGSFREPFLTAEATRSLLADSDSLFGILVTQQGRFSYDGEGVRFQDPEAARAYATLRQEIVSTLADWRDSTANQALVTMPRLLRAFQGSLPPQVTK